MWSKIKNYVTSSKPKKLVAGPYSTTWSYISLAYYKIWQMKKNTRKHFEEESIIYIWSKFQLDTFMFGSNILLTKCGLGSRALVPGFIPSL